MKIFIKSLLKTVWYEIITYPVLVLGSIFMDYRNWKNVWWEILIIDMIILPIFCRLIYVEEKKKEKKFNNN